MSTGSRTTFTNTPIVLTFKGVRVPPTALNIEIVASITPKTIRPNENILP
ncbi:MAG: hypothetical protein QXH57_04985 [Sulfolobales archaeon]